MRARITVYPRREILDPQGKAIRSALAGLGFDQVEDVRAGKSFEVELATEDGARARDALDAMCRKLLANTVTEDYEIELDGAAAGGGPAAKTAAKAAAAKPGAGTKAAKPAAAEASKPAAKPASAAAGEPAKAAAKAARAGKPAKPSKPASSSKPTPAGGRR